MFSLPALAHPHSWVDMKTEILGQNDTITGFKMQWTFDRMTTAYLLDGEDMTPHHRVKTLKAITQSVIKNMLPSHNFTYLEEGKGKKKHLLHYQAITDGHFDVVKGKAIFNFTLPLLHPYQFNQNKPLSLRIFDPTYYVDMSWTSKDDVQFSPTLKPYCSATMIEPHPTPAQVNKAMAIPIDASPNYELGKVFTQAVTFSCHYENK